MVAHTSQRSQYASIITQFLQGVTSTFPWTKWDGVDVLFGGGAEYFLPNKANNNTARAYGTILLGELSTCRS